MIKLVMQCRATLIEEILDVTLQPIIQFLFTPLLTNKTQICNRIVPQTLLLFYTISCLFLFFFVDNHVFIL